MATRYSIEVIRHPTYIEPVMEEDDDGDYIHEDDYVHLVNALAHIRANLTPNSPLWHYVSRVLADS